MGEGSERMGDEGSRDVARDAAAPTSLPAPAVDVTAGPATVAPEGQRRLLVVEDDATLRESLVLLLGGAAFDVRGAARRTRDFATTLRELPPDLAILDVDLGAGRPSGSRWPASCSERRRYRSSS
jgi:PleD family two-component response regulator